MSEQFAAASIQSFLPGAVEAEAGHMKEHLCTVNDTYYVRI